METQIKHFRLIDLFFVLAVMFLVAAIAVVAVSRSKPKARDARRVQDIHQLKSALALYLANCNSYPQTNRPILLNSSVGISTGTRVNCGNHTGSSDNGGIGKDPSGKVLITQILEAPKPIDDGNLAPNAKCSDKNGNYTWNDYIYTSSHPEKFIVTFCLSSQVGEIAAGRHALTEQGIK